MEIKDKIITTESLKELHEYNKNTYVTKALGSNAISSSEAQTAIGKYNVEDTTNTYGFMLGNGESDSSRSNAMTVDWEGTAWFAGDFSADGNIILSSNQYGDELPAAGNVGRIFFKRLVEE